MGNIKIQRFLPEIFKVHHLKSKFSKYRQILNE
jgi:hypothetical protein